MGINITGDGRVTINGEDMVNRSRLDEFRDNNISLRKELESVDYRFERYEREIKILEDKYAGIDLDEWASLQAERKAMAENELMEIKDVDAFIDERVSEVVEYHTNLRKDLESRLASAEKDLEIAELKLKLNVIEASRKNTDTGEK